MQDSQDRFKKVGVYGILRTGDKIFMLQRANTGFEDGNYGLVSGHVDDDESLAQALVREVKEEAGVDIRAEDARLVTVMHRARVNRIDFYFEITKWEGEPYNAEPDKCSDASWFSLKKLPEPTIVYIEQALNCYQKGTTYSEFGWDS
ncbi:MAG: hydrolase [Candidatus Kaiserbacteria bacterium]|nr:hydrolase [Candidatus Kaiserbacteria bacterium]